MSKYSKDSEKVNISPLLGRWVWKYDAKKLEFIREESVLKTTQTSNNFKELQQRAEWLADIFTMAHRGSQSVRIIRSSAHFNAYRSSVLKREGDRVTIDDVKQVAVGLLQENYLLPIPHRFLDLLTSEGFDEVLATLLLYLSCFFDHRSLDNKPMPLADVDSMSECRMMVEALAKKDMAQKKLAVCFFRLMMDLERDQHCPYRKSQMSSNRTGWLLHATFSKIQEYLWTRIEPSADQIECIYSFSCYVAWVTFGRKDLKDIQEEVGRLLYSDAFNTAVKNTTDRNSKMISDTDNGSLKTGAADCKMATCNNALKPRTSQRRPPLSSVVNQRSPLMVSLLPSPKERSPHLFLGSRARSQIPLKAECCDTKALMKQLDQQVASVSFGILGKPLAHFSHSTLLPYGEQKNRDECEDKEAGSDVNYSADHPGIHVQGTDLSFVGMKSTAPSKYGSTTLIKTKNCDLAH